jgi:hypothetical protein
MVASILLGLFVAALILSAVEKKTPHSLSPFGAA